MADLLLLLNNQWLAKLLGGYCGGAVWMTGLRACCGATRKMVQAPEKYRDEECMLKAGVDRGDVGLCDFAICKGACKFFSMAKRAARRSKYVIFRMAINELGTMSNETMMPLFSSAVEGKDIRIVRTVLGMMGPFMSYLELGGGENRLDHDLIAELARASYRTADFEKYREVLELYSGMRKMPTARLESLAPTLTGSLYMLSYGLTLDEKYFKRGEGLFNESRSANYLAALDGAVKSGSRIMLDTVTKRVLSRGLTEESVLERTLMLAATHGCLDLCREIECRLRGDVSLEFKLLIEISPPLHAGGHSSQSALETAAAYGHIDVCKWLVDLKLVRPDKMLNAFAWSKVKGWKEGCLLAMHMGATDLEGMLSCASFHGTYEACKSSLFWGASQVVVLFINGLWRGNLDMCLLALEGGRRIYESGVRKPGLLKLFGLNSAAEFDKALAEGKLMGSPPFLAVALGLAPEKYEKTCRQMKDYIASDGCKSQGEPFVSKVIVALQLWKQPCRFVVRNGRHSIFY